MDVNLELLPFSFFAGVMTFFNPCFGALLPTYISLYLAREEAETAPWWARGLQGLRLGGAISAGMLTSLGLLGLIFAWVGSAISRYLPWMAVLVALGVTLLGVFILVRPSTAPSLGAALSRWLPLKAQGNDFLSFYVYGLFYAVCASACTLPIFLAVMTQTFLGGPVNGLLHFAAYGWGMSAMMLLFGLLLAYAKEAVYRIFRSMSVWVKWASGAFMILAGGYVLYYLLIYGRYLDDLLGR
jgi:cytochrome c biogenesis protein CcdA